MKKTLGTILFIIYSIIAITVTILLLSYNEFRCSEIGGYTVYIVRDDSLEPKFKEGSILLIKSTNDKHIKEGDELFFYKVITNEEYEFVSRTLKNKSQQGRHTTYHVEAEGIAERYDTTYFIGKLDDTIIIDAPWGTILSILESKWGYLFAIVIVSLLLFLQQVFDLIIEIKYGKYSKAQAQKANTKAKTKTKKVVAVQKAETENKVEEEVK